MGSYRYALPHRPVFTFLANLRPRISPYLPRKPLRDKVSKFYASTGPKTRRGAAASMRSLASCPSNFTAPVEPLDPPKGKWGYRGFYARIGRKDVINVSKNTSIIVIHGNSELGPSSGRTRCASSDKSPVCSSSLWLLQEGLQKIFLRKTTGAKGKHHAAAVRRKSLTVTTFSKLCLIRPIPRKIAEDTARTHGWLKPRARGRRPWCRFSTFMI